MFWLADSFKKRVATFILKRLIGRFLMEEIDPDNLEVNLSGGHFSLEDIKLNVEVINTFLRDVPFKLTEGSIKKISITTPWRNIVNESMRIEVDGIDLRARFDNVENNSQNQSFLGRSHVPTEVVASSILLGDFGSEEVEEEFKELEQEADSGGVEGLEGYGMSGIARIIDKVVSNIKAKVTDATFRVSFPESELHEPPVLLLHIPELDYFDETPQNSEFQDEAHKWFSSLMVKIIRFQGFSLQLYEEDEFENSFCSKSQQATHDGHTIAFSDIDNEVRVQLYTGSPIEKCLPFLDIKCFVSALHFMLKPNHFRMVMDIMDSIKNNLSPSSNQKKHPPKKSQEQSSIYKTVEGSGTYSSGDLGEENSEENSEEIFNNFSVDIPSPGVSYSSENNHMERAESLLSPNTPPEDDGSQFFSVTSSHFHHSEVLPQEIGTESFNNSLKIQLQIEKVTCRVLYENVDLTNLWNEFIASENRRYKDPDPEADHLCIAVNNLDLSSENNQELNELIFNINDITMSEKILTNQNQGKTFRHLLSFIKPEFSDCNNHSIYGKFRFEKTAAKFKNEIKLKPLKLEVDLGVTQRIANLINNSKPNIKSEGDLPPNVDLKAFDDSPDGLSANKTKQNPSFSSSTQISLEYLSLVFLYPKDPQDPVRGVKPQQLGAEIHDMNWIYEQKSPSLGSNLSGSINSMKLLLIDNERGIEKVGIVTEYSYPESLQIHVQFQEDLEKEETGFQSIDLGKAGNEAKEPGRYDIDSDDLGLSESDESSNSVSLQDESPPNIQWEANDENNIDLATKQEKVIQAADISVMISAPCAQIDLSKSEFFYLQHMIEDTVKLLTSPFSASEPNESNGTNSPPSEEKEHKEKIIAVEFTLDEAIVLLHAPGGIVNPTGDLQTDLANRSMHHLEALFREFKVLTTIHAKENSSVSIYVATNEFDVSEIFDDDDDTSVPLLRKHKSLKKTKQNRKSLVVDVSLDLNPSLVSANIKVSLSNMLMNHYTVPGHELWFMCLANFFDESIEDPEIVSNIKLNLSLDIGCRDCTIDYNPTLTDGRLFLLFGDLKVFTEIFHNQPKFILNIHATETSALLHDDFKQDLIYYSEKFDMRHSSYITNLKEIGFAQIAGLDDLLVQLFINNGDASRKDPPLLIKISSDHENTLGLDFCSDSLTLLNSLISSLSPADSNEVTKEDDDNQSSSSTVGINPTLYPSLSDEGNGVETAINESLIASHQEPSSPTKPISNVSRVSNFKIYDSYVSSNGGHKPLSMENMVSTESGIMLKEQEDHVVKMSDNFSSALSRISKTSSQETSQSPEPDSGKECMPKNGPPPGVPIDDDYVLNRNLNNNNNNRNNGRDSDDEWIHTDAEFLRQRERRNEPRDDDENDSSPAPVHLVYVDTPEKEEARLYQSIHEIQDYVSIPSFADSQIQRTISDKYPVPTLEFALCNFDFRIRLFSGQEWPKINHQEEKGDEEPTARLVEGSEWRGSTRDYHNLVELDVTDLYVQYDNFAETEDYAWLLYVSVKDAVIHDAIQSSNRSKLLSYLSTIPRSRSSRILEITAESLRTDKKHPNSQDLCLNIDVLPLRINVNQNTLMFLLDFFLSNNSSNNNNDDNTTENEGCVNENINDDNEQDGEGSIDGREEKRRREQEIMTPNEENQPQNIEVDARNATYFQQVKISKLRLRIDYDPTHVDYQKLRKGGYTELANLIKISGLDVELRPAEVKGAVGSESLIQSLTEIWLPDVTGTKLFRCLLGVMPIRSVYNIGSGLADLVVVPLNQYQHNGHVMRGFQRGFSSFMTNVAGETMGITAQVSSGTRSLLSAIQNVIQGEQQQESPSPSQLGMPSDAVEGLQQAYSSLSRGFSNAGCAVVAIPHKYHTGGSYGAARSAAQAVPVAVLSPMIGATEALSSVMLGLRNWWDPERKREHDEIYKY